METEHFAARLRSMAYQTYGVLLCGSPTPNQESLLKKMKTVDIGSLVFESSTVWMDNALDAVGVLKKTAMEKVDFGDPDFIWNEVEEGRPHPTELIFYIETLDGREFRWSNANFLSIPFEIKPDTFVG